MYSTVGTSVILEDLLGERVGLELSKIIYFSLSHSISWRPSGSFSD